MPAAESASRNHSSCRQLEIRVRLVPVVVQWLVASDTDCPPETGKKLLAATLSPPNSPEGMPPNLVVELLFVAAPLVEILEPKKLVTVALGGISLATNDRNSAIL
eukprot:Gregarina_sp_Poly_1__9736@NODE_61_length_16710_cov_172_464520_g52_i0_p13_GENE_NODE_61_length_16710_cov_172_464520_g52_i0NODE_61_length_16710_cov_172_464520_g52_i0_p13_ORF_typecomplete_len105_score10_09_NODE_61_length_16710_cov_172_464520_g52_i080828396